MLAALLPPGALGPDAARPRGLDRVGLPLPIERPVGSSDVRLAFPQPLTCAVRS